MYHLKSCILVRQEKNFCLDVNRKKCLDPQFYSGQKNGLTSFKQVSSVAGC